MNLATPARPWVSLHSKHKFPNCRRHGAPYATSNLAFSAAGTLHVRDKEHKPNERGPKGCECGHLLRHSPAADA